MPGRGQPWKEGGHVDSTIVGADVKDLTITNADVANSTIESGKASLFKSAPTTMTGAPVLIPHGLGRVPALIRITIVDGPVAYVAPAIVEGAPTSTDISVTGAVGWIVVAEAW